MTKRTVIPEYPGAKFSTEQSCCSLVTKSCLIRLQSHELYSQAPLSMGFTRQESWSELPFPSPKDLPDPGIEPASPTLQADPLLSESPGRFTALKVTLKSLT